ncbi:MAG: glycosyltransferase family 4 protein [Pseudomonadota bacterium]
MSPERRIVHVLDDLAMGGVTRALKNFEHPQLSGLGKHVTVDIRTAAVRATSPDDIAIVHFTASWRKLPWLADLRFRGRFSRIILIEHTYTEGFERFEVDHLARFRQMLKYAYRLADTVVAVSHAQKRWIVGSGLASAQKVLAIPQSRDCADLLQLPLPQRGQGPLQIGAFGRFHRQKGFDLLLEAMSRIPPRLAELKLAGTGPEGAGFWAMAERLPHVEICSPFVSPDRFLAGVDVVAIPSRWEAFGLVGAEARAAGRPILAARVDGLIDQLGAGAFPHDCADVASLTASIYRAACTGDLHERGQLARRQAAGEFDAMIEAWSGALVQQTYAEAA